MFKINIMLIMKFITAVVCVLLACFAAHLWSES